LYIYEGDLMEIDLFIVLLLTGMGILFIALIVCVILLVRRGKKYKNAETAGDDADISPQNNADAGDWRTFKLLDEGLGDNISKQETHLLNNNQNRENQTAALFGSGAAQPQPDDSPKTELLFQEPQKKGGGNAGIKNLAVITYTIGGSQYSYHMKEPVVCIGRDLRKNDIVVEDDKQMGRMHGIIMIKSGKMVYLDLNSKNGSYIINSQKKPVRIDGMTELTAETSLKLANTVFTVKRNF